MKILIIAGAIFVLGAIPVAGQTGAKQPTKAALPAPAAQHVRSSPAYAEVLVRKTELAAEMESMLVEYTEDFPKIKEMRYELDVLEKELARFNAVKPADAAKLSAGLGRLVVRKAALDTELWLLLLQYKEEHPDVRRAKRKAEMFDAAIKEILG